MKAELRDPTPPREVVVTMSEEEARARRVTIAGRRLRVKTRGDGNWHHIASFGRLVVRRNPEGWLTSTLYPDTDRFGPLLRQAVEAL